MRKTFTYKPQPTAEQEGTLAFVLRRCRERYTAGLQERHNAWQKCGASITAASQSAQLPAIKEVRSEYRDVHSQVLQDVLTRLDRAFGAFFTRMQGGPDAGLSPLSQRQPLHQFHLQTVWQRGDAGERRVSAV